MSHSMPNHQIQIYLQHVSFRYIPVSPYSNLFHYLLFNYQTIPPIPHSLSYILSCKLHAKTWANNTPSRKIIQFHQTSSVRNGKPTYELGTRCQGLISFFSQVRCNIEHFSLNGQKQNSTKKQHSSIEISGNYKHRPIPVRTSIAEQNSTGFTNQCKA